MVEAYRSALPIRSRHVAANGFISRSALQMSEPETQPTQRPPEVVVVGACNVDLIAYMERIPSIGETLSGNKFQEEFGGKGANQAVQSSLLGVSTYFCGRIGEDKFGDATLVQLGEYGVNTNALKKCPTQTGIACISVDGEGANTIVIIPGANGMVSYDDIQAISEDISTAKVIVCQNEIPYSASLEAMKAARACGTMSIYNPAPATPWREIEELIEQADLLCPNESELRILTGLPVDTEEEIVVAAQALIDIGSKVVVVTLGKRGALIKTATDHKLISAETVVAKDTVGAGDSFIGSMAANLARGAIIEDAVRRALGIATKSVTRIGAQASYFGLPELPAELHPPLRKESNALKEALASNLLPTMESDEMKQLVI